MCCIHDKTCPKKTICSGGFDLVYSTMNSIYLKVSVYSPGNRRESRTINTPSSWSFNLSLTVSLKWKKIDISPVHIRDIWLINQAREPYKENIRPRSVQKRPRADILPLRPSHLVSKRFITQLKLPPKTSKSDLAGSSGTLPRTRILDQQWSNRIGWS